MQERERLARLGRRGIAPLLRTIGVCEAVWLVTCNRVELYFVTHGRREGKRATVRRLAAAWQHAVGTDPIARKALGHLRVFTDGRAVEHLVRVAAGLDSRVHGEREVLGQIRTAYRQAKADRLLGSRLDRLVQAAIAAARAVRGPGFGCVGGSVAQSAVWAAARRLRPLQGRLALVIGTGHVASDVVGALRRLGVFEITVIGRDPDRTDRAAKAWGVAAGAFAARFDLAKAADLVIAATRAETPVLAGTVPVGASRTRLIIDLGMPRNVSPDAAISLGADLLTVDDFSIGASQTADDKEQRAAQAAKAVWRQLTVRPPRRTIAHFRRKAEAMARAESERLAAKFGEMDSAQRSRLEQALVQLVHRVLDEPTRALVAWSRPSPRLIRHIGLRRLKRTVRASRIRSAGGGRG